MFSNIRYISSEIQYTACDIWQEIRRSDPIRGIDRFYSMNGLDKISKAMIPVFKILEAYSFQVKTALSIARGQRDLYQSTHVVPSILNFLQKPTISKVCSLLESIFRTGHVLVKYEVCRFEIYQQIACRLGEYSIFRSSVLQHWLKAPGDLFQFLTGICEVSRLSHFYWQRSTRAHIQANNKCNHVLVRPRERIKRRRELLQLVSWIGKMSLSLLRGNASTWNGSSLLGFYVLEVGVHSISLLRIFIRNS